MLRAADLILWISNLNKITKDIWKRKITPGIVLCLILNTGWSWSKNIISPR